LEVGRFMTFFTVYRTQNLVNGRYYFGVHKTKDPYDGYLGSGKILKRAIIKYGEPAFIKNLCFIFDNPEEAFAKEFELIETYRQDSLCYNLRQGGSGGFDWINREGKADYSRAAKMSHGSKSKRDPNHYMKMVEGRRKKGYGVAPQFIGIWSGRKHTSETKAKMALAASLRVGEKNSQHGTCWVTDGVTNMKVKQSDLSTYLVGSWKRGRV